MAGGFNRQSFNTPRFKKIVHALKTGTIENLDKIKEFSSDQDLFAFKEEVEGILMSNKIFAGATLLHTPDFKKLLDQTMELKILKNPDLIKLEESKRLMEKLTSEPQSRQNL